VSGAPLVELEQARIEAEEVPLFDGVSCALGGRRLGLEGPWEALFGLLERRFRLASGRAEVLGVPAFEAVPRGHVGLLTRSARLVRGFRVGQLLEESARLLGQGAGPARALALRALEELNLGSLAARDTESLTRFEYRAAALAHACLGSPRVLALEAPFEALSEQEADAFAPLVERATEDRALLISTRGLYALGAERSLFERLDRTFRLDARGVLQAPSLREGPDDGTPWSLSAVGNVEALLQRLTERGARVRSIAPGGRSGAVVGDSNAEAARVVLTLGSSLEVSQVLELSLEVHSAVVELVPLQA
jgi:predicted ABC-type transport system involved in lysophospholipase L1 biosynthesis ATPase subunit